VLHIKRLLGQIRRAIQDYNMIQDGEQNSGWVSGGKDSLTLLVALRQLKNFLPVKFELKAITLTMGIGEVDLSPVRELCERIDVSYTVEETLIGKIVFEERKEKNPCSLCASLRRGALHNTAKDWDATKLLLLITCMTLSRLFS